MQKVVLTAAIAVALTVSTVLIICSIDGMAVCAPSVDNAIQFSVYKDYCILPYITRSPMEDNMEIYDRITLAIHISAQYLDERIVEQIDAWEGPVTLSIVIPSIQVLRHIRRTQVQLAGLPSTALDKLSAHLLFHSNVGCSPRAVADLNEPSASKSYPVNVARNAARMFVRSKYLLIGDYEFVFSRGFERRMRNLAKDKLAKDPKTALVFRIFEVNETVDKLPRDKDSLRKLFYNGTAVEFHAKFTRNAHKIPRLIRWFNHEANDTKATIASVLPFSRRDWEPQFVSLTTIPFHDENFPFSLRDNTVLRWEMCRMNYTFALVHDVFMVHRGIKTMDDVPRIKQMQRKARPQFAKAMRKFEARMDRDFPETKKLCPEFGA